MLNEFRGKREKATQAISINTTIFFSFILFMACFWLFSQKLYQCDPVVSVKSMIYGHQKNSSDRKSSLRCMRWSKIARELEGRARGNTREARKSERASRVFLPRVRCSNSRSIAVGFPLHCLYASILHLPTLPSTRYGISDRPFEIHRRAKFLMAARFCRLPPVCGNPSICRCAGVSLMSPSCKFTGSSPSVTRMQKKKF